MKIPISPRLLACAGLVKKGARIADIGCDHGYLCIHLLKEGIAEAAIASDINKGPLESARRNAVKYGVADKIRFYLSDGARQIDRDFDTLICAGMGADTMISILEAAPWLRSPQYSLILQCQSKTPMLRQYLSDHGYSISRELALRDGRFLYTVMAVQYRPQAPRLTAAQCYFSPALQETASPEAQAYLQWVTGGLRTALAHRQDVQMQAALEALEQLPGINKEQNPQEEPK